MKSALLFLSYLLFAFSTNPFLASSTPVKDISGDELRPGTDYYILPVIRGRGGGLTLAATRNVSCLLDVVQEQNEVDDGLPVTFSPVNSGDGVIRLNTDLNIEFSASTICIISTVWKLENYEGNYIVGTGGVKGNPGGETLSNWFKIEKDGNDYKLVFCPTVCDICRPVCGDIGVLTNNGTRRLGLSEVPFKVMFRKA